MAAAIADVILDRLIMNLYCKYCGLECTRLRHLRRIASMPRSSPGHGPPANNDQGYSNGCCSESWFKVGARWYSLQQFLAACHFIRGVWESPGALVWAGSKAAAYQYPEYISVRQARIPLPLHRLAFAPVRNNNPVRIDVVGAVGRRWQFPNPCLRIHRGPSVSD